MGNELGHLVDSHVIVFDQFGNGIYGPQENGLMYPSASLTGKGKIAGCEVKCISVEYQLISHTGYKLREKDFKDVAALCKKFNLKLPAGYTSIF